MCVIGNARDDPSSIQCCGGSGAGFAYTAAGFAYTAATADAPAAGHAAGRASVVSTTQYGYSIIYMG